MPVGGKKGLAHLTWCVADQKLESGNTYTFGTLIARSSQAARAHLLALVLMSSTQAGSNRKPCPAQHNPSAPLQAHTQESWAHLPALVLMSDMHCSSGAGAQLASCASWGVPAAAAEGVASSVTASGTACTAGSAALDATSCSSSDRTGAAAGKRACRGGA